MAGGMSDYCYYTTVKDHGRVLIPGCYGAAVYGEHRCTCKTQKQAKSLEERIASLEGEIRTLKSIIKNFKQ